MSKTSIEWTEKVWNPIAGCSIVSPGCTNCYAMPIAARLERMQPDGHYRGLTKHVKFNPVWTGKIARAPDHIFNAPLKWRKPTRVFVNSMSDLFHEDVPDEWIEEIFSVIARCPQHKFQILTKRPERMRTYMLGLGYVLNGAWKRYVPANAWLGVSVEDQARADERIPLLLETPAAVRFVSAEPLLGSLDLKKYLTRRRIVDSAGDVDDDWPQKILDWVIVGGESGPGKRPVDMDWMRAIKDDCKSAGVPVFIKQIDKVIHIPDDLMIREFPE